MTARGEQAFLDWLRTTGASREDILVPIGDDAAVMRPRADLDLVVSADAIAEGAHFHPGTTPEDIGRKALAVNLSDFAAMGAMPRFAFATAALPRGFHHETAVRITEGMRAIGAGHGVALCGGDTITHEGGLVLSVTLVGYVEPGLAVQRKGARVGDVIVVTGALGGSLPFGRHLSFTPRLAEGRKLATEGPPSAMMDVSDGLLLDLSRLCTMSGVGARIDASAIPIHADARRSDGDPLDHALTDGEDFELLFTMSPERLARVERNWCGNAPLSRIGVVTARGLTLVRDGRELEVEARGFEHH